MEITIDTSKDSKEDIRRVIALLSQIVDKAPRESARSDPSTPPVAPGMFSMFDAATNVPESTSSGVPITSDLIPEVTQTQEKSQGQLFNDPMNILFDKNDAELEEVQKLKEKSATKGEDLRIIAYK
ncbi:MAG: hypothetical protein ABIJ21_09175 [Nanoarchaeota archaeon]